MTPPESPAAAGPLVLAIRGMMVSYLHHGLAELAAQSVSCRPAAGVEGHVPLPGSQGNLHRAVSSGAAAGGGALSRGAATERKSRHRRDHVHCLRSVRA